MKYTPEEIADLINCANDPLYFAQKVLKSLSTGKFEPLSALQTVWLTSTARGINMGTERQSRRTSTMLVKALWTATYKPNQSIMFATHRHQSAQDARSTIKLMHDNLPEHLKHDIKSNNQQRIEFVNGSSIHFDSITERIGRGRSFDLLLIDNTSLVRPNVYEEAMMSLLPSLSTSMGQLMEAM